MGFELMNFSSESLKQYAANEIAEKSGYTEKYGIIIGGTQAARLVETRFFALNETGRIEFGAGAIEKLIHTFCDSPYLTKANYEDVLNELLEIFYYFKNEMLDRVSDDKLLKLMREEFDNCGGSVEFLSGTILERTADGIRRGKTLSQALADAKQIPNENKDKE